MKFEENFLKDRADTFLENAHELMKKRKLDIAVFNFEQAAQLYLKHYLFTQTKDFARTHDLTELLQATSKIHAFPSKIKRFVKENILMINDLGDAYLTSRYLPVNFPLAKVRLMYGFVKKLKKLLFKK